MLSYESQSQCLGGFCQVECVCLCVCVCVCLCLCVWLWVSLAYPYFVSILTESLRSRFLRIDTSSTVITCNMSTIM